MTPDPDPNAKVDPIEASVLHRRLKSITEEMGLTLLRTTRSPILNEARDFVTGLYDAKGQMLEQTEYIPVLAFALQPACEHIVRFFGDDIHEGDVILHNDVFSGGNQNNDVAVFRPVFRDGVLAAWAACKGHQADIGGAQSGGYNPEAREVWQEALRITPIKVHERGELRRDVWRMIFANIRYRIVEEDIKAQIGATRVGERGMHELFRRFDGPRFDACIAYLFAASERIVRREIAAIADGVYRGESWVFYDGVNDASRMKINLAVTVAGDEVTFDFTGSSPQTPGFVNAPHDHRTWAVVAVYEGEERNVFYERRDGSLVAKGSVVASAPRVVVMRPDAIHAIENRLPTPSYAIHAYGNAHFHVERSMWHPETFREEPRDDAKLGVWTRDMIARGVRLPDVGG